MKNIILLLSIMCSLSCTSLQKEQTSDNAKAVISYESKGCFGRCPQEKLTIYDNRVIVYSGVKKVDHIGTFSQTISKKEYVRLLELFSEAAFDNLEDQYLSNLRDIAKFEITKDKKSIEYHERNAPAALKSIQKEMKRIIDSQNWKKK